MYPAVIAGDIKFLQLLRVRPGLSGSCSRTLWMLCLVSCVVTVLRKFHTYGKVKVSAKTRTCKLARVSFGRDVPQAHALQASAYLHFLVAMVQPLVSINQGHVTWLQVFIFCGVSG